MKNLLRRIFGFGASKSTRAKPVIVVSGLPRSGTSMMMKMLEAGGMPVLSDGLRAADSDNPKGYYEYERVKALDKGDSAWVADAQGKVVKVIAALLEHLPADFHYKVLFMHRAIDEVLASQQKMLVRRGEDPHKVSDAEMARLFDKHLGKITAWLAAQHHIDVLDVDYNRLVADPMPQVRAINRFLGGGLDEDAMAGAVDPGLYRNRATGQG